jgi:hypothetical protein
MVETPIFTKKHTAEFNTSADSLSQLANYEWILDWKWIELREDIRTHQKVDYVHFLFDLTLIYSDRLIAIAWKDKADEIREWEKEIRLLYDDWKKNNQQHIPTMLIEKLRLYKQWLYIVKQQNIKLGIPMREERSASDAVKKAIG